LKAAGLALFLAGLAPLCPPALAFDAPKGSRLDSALYKPSAELLKSLLNDEHVQSKIDHEGDLEVTFHGNDVAFEGWIVLDKLDDGKIWNLRFTAPVPASEVQGMDQDSLMLFANNWNRDEIAIKLYVDDEGVLQTEHDLAAQFGLNPQEFQENGIRLYESALARLVDHLAEARGGGSGTDNGSSGSSNGSSGGSGSSSNSTPPPGNGNEQPQKSTAQPDQGEGI
jgi:hypothetical protein